MLANIRRPYLNVDSRAVPTYRQPARNLDLDASDQSWNAIRRLSNQERDQIDLQARVILTRCADRVKEMEGIEKRMEFSFLDSLHNIHSLQDALSLWQARQIRSRVFSLRASGRKTRLHYHRTSSPLTILASPGILTAG